MKTVRAMTLLAGVVLGATAAWSQVVQFVVVQRQANYVQTGPTTVVADSFNPARFGASVEGDTLMTSVNPVTSATFTAPGGAPVAMTFDSMEYRWRYQQNFSSLSAVNAAFTTGSYTFNLTGTPSGSASITVGSFASSPLQVPLLTLSGGNWVGQTYQLALGAVLDIAFNPIFTGPVSSTSGFHFDANIYGPGGYAETEGFANWDPTINQAASTASTPSLWSLPATSTGSYTLEVNYSDIQNPAPIYSSAFSASLLEYRTQVSIVVVPEPSTWASLLLGLATLGLIQIRRRNG